MTYLTAGDVTTEDSSSSHILSKLRIASDQQIFTIEQAGSSGQQCAHAYKAINVRLGQLINIVAAVAFSTVGDEGSI